MWRFAGGRPGAGRTACAEDIAAAIESEVSSWRGRHGRPAPLGGVEFRLGRRELGHLHPARTCRSRRGSATCSSRRARELHRAGIRGWVGAVRERRRRAVPARTSGHASHRTSPGPLAGVGDGLRAVLRRRRAADGIAEHADPSTSSSTTSPGCSHRPSPCSRMQPVPTVPEPRTSPGRSVVFRAACARMRPTSGRGRAGCRATAPPRSPARPSPPAPVELVDGDEHRAERRREVLALRRPEPDRHLRRWRSRADQSFMIVNPPIAPSAPITAASSSSKSSSSSRPETGPRRLARRSRPGSRSRRPGCSYHSCGGRPALGAPELAARAPRTHEVADARRAAARAGGGDVGERGTRRARARRRRR